MSPMVTPEVLQDDLAVAVARVLATANKRAAELGIDVHQSSISLSQSFENGPRWQVNYGPKDYVNHRGGDVMIEVGANDLVITRVLRGQ